MKHPNVSVGVANHDRHGDVIWRWYKKLSIRSILPDNMLGKRKRIVVRVDEKRDKGSHITLYFGLNFTIVRNPKDELKKGTYHAMMNQLGINEDELNE